MNVHEHAVCVHVYGREKERERVRERASARPCGRESVRACVRVVACVRVCDVHICACAHDWCVGSVHAGTGKLSNRSGASCARSSSSISCKARRREGCRLTLYVMSVYKSMNTHELHLRCGTLNRNSSPHNQACVQIHNKHQNKNVKTDMHANMHSCPHTSIHTYIHTCIHLHTCTRTCMHT